MLKRNFKLNRILHCFSFLLLYNSELDINFICRSTTHTHTKLWVLQILYHSRFFLLHSFHPSIYVVWPETMENLIFNTAHLACQYQVFIAIFIIHLCITYILPGIFEFLDKTNKNRRRKQKVVSLYLYRMFVFI